MIILKEEVSDLGENPRCGEQRLDVTCLLTYWQLQDLWMGFRVSIQYREWTHPTTGVKYFFRGFKAGSLHNDNFNGLIETTIFFQKRLGNEGFISPRLNCYDTTTDNVRCPCFVDLIIRGTPSIPRTYDIDTLVHTSTFVNFRIATDASYRAKNTTVNSINVPYTLGVLLSVNGEESYNYMDPETRAVTYSGFSITFESKIPNFELSKENFGLGFKFVDYGNPYDGGTVTTYNYWYNPLPLGIIGDSNNYRSYVNLSNSLWQSNNRFPFDFVQKNQFHYYPVNEGFRRCEYPSHYMMNYERFYLIQGLSSDDLGTENAEYTLELLPSLEVYNQNFPELAYLSGHQVHEAKYVGITGGRYVYSFDFPEGTISWYGCIPGSTNHDKALCVYDNGIKLSSASTGWLKINAYQISLYSKPAGTVSYTACSGYETAYIPGNSSDNFLKPGGRVIKVTPELQALRSPAGAGFNSREYLLVSPLNWAKGENNYTTATAVLSGRMEILAGWVTAGEAYYWDLTLGVNKIYSFTSGSGTGLTTFLSGLSSLYINYLLCSVEGASSNSATYNSVYRYEIPTKIDNFIALKAYLLKNHPSKDWDFIKRITEMDTAFIVNEDSHYLRNNIYRETTNVLEIINSTRHKMLALAKVSQLYLHGLVSAVYRVPISSFYGIHFYTCRKVTRPTGITDAPYIKLVHLNEGYKSILAVSYYANTSPSTLATSIPVGTQSHWTLTKRYVRYTINTDAKYSSINTLVMEKERADTATVTLTPRDISTVTTPANEITHGGSASSTAFSYYAPAKHYTCKMINPLYEPYELTWHVEGAGGEYYDVTGYSMNPFTRDMTYKMVRYLI